MKKGRGSLADARTRFVTAARNKLLGVEKLSGSNTASEVARLRGWPDAISKTTLTGYLADELEFIAVGIKRERSRRKGLEGTLHRLQCQTLILS